MKSNRFAYISLVISILAIVLSIVAIILFIVNKTTAEVSFHYCDASITVLSILVTALLGWNIWSVIDNRGLERTINKLKIEIDSSLDNFLSDRSEMFASIHEEFALIAINDFIKNPNKSNAYTIVKHSIQAIVSYQYIGNCKKADDLIEWIIKTISKSTYSSIEYERRKKIIDTVKMIKQPEKLKKYDLLMNYIYGDDSERPNSKNVNVHTDT